MTRSPSLADLVRILYRPRETMRRILDSGPHRWSAQVVILAFVCASVNDPNVIHALLPGVKLGATMATIAFGIIVGALAWVLVLFILSWIAAPIGRLLGGAAPVADVRAALAWGMTPVVWSPIYRIPSGIIGARLRAGPQINVQRVLLDFVAHGGCSIVVIFLTMQLVFMVATVVLGSLTLAEAQRFSGEKGFVNVAVAVLFPLLVFFAAVFTFGR